MVSLQQKEFAYLVLLAELAKVSCMQEEGDLQ